MAAIRIPPSVTDVNSNAASVPNNWFSTLLSNAQKVADTFYSNAERWRTFNDGDSGVQGNMMGGQTAYAQPESQFDKYLPFLAIGGLALVAVVALKK